MGRIGFWELTAAGAAVGGTGVWALGVAARVGLLRLLLELFPRSTWDGVTWVLIPSLFLLPPVILGLSLAYLPGVRPGSAVRSVGGGVLGTGVAAVVFGTGALVALQYLPGATIVQLARTIPEVVIPALGILLLAGWLLIAGRVLGAGWLRTAALPLAAAAVIFVSFRAHGQMPVVTSVLERPEVNGLFASVAVGGALGSAWALCAREAVRPEPRRRAPGSGAP